MALSSSLEEKLVNGPIEGITFVQRLHLAMWHYYGKINESEIEKIIEFCQGVNRHQRELDLDEADI